MVTCLGEVHIWTLRSQTIIQDNEIGCFTYHEKNETVTNAEQPYYEEKKYYTESRDATWAPKNKRPDKLRDALKEVEDLLAVHKCVQSRWLTRRLLQIFLANGVVVYFVVSLHTGDVDKMFIDKTLVGKLSGECPSDVLATDGYLVFAYPDKPKLDYVYFFKKPPTGESIRKLEKLSTFEFKVSQVELPGPSGRRLDRQLVCNLHQDMVLAWWPTASEEAWPWAPMTGEKDRANLVLLAANGPKLDLITFVRTECDPIGVSFSMSQPHQILTVEQASAAGGEISVDLCMYDNNRSKIQRLTVTTIPLKSTVTCYSRNPSEDKTLLGCEDGTLVLYDEYKKLSQMTVASLMPVHISWHPSGLVVLVASQRGELQVLDMALAPLLFQVVAENPSPSPTLQLGQYFRSPPSLDQVHWSPYVEQQDLIAECVDSLFMVFDRGPLTLLQYQLGVVSQGHLTPLLLINQYIKHRQIEEAINFLSGMKWNVEGPTCYACLSAIVNHLLKCPLNAEREAQLEAALGTFYAPVKPLSEVTVLEYRDPISRLARRFFHHLLRFTRFDKAFLLAVDIGARDLFMDIHYLAKDKGEVALAEVARRKAEQIDAESLGSESVDGYEEVSDDDSLSDSYDEEDEDGNVDGPPPRPPKRHPPPSIGKGPPPPLPPEPFFSVPPSDPRFLPKRQHPRPELSRPTWGRQAYMDLPESTLKSLEEELTSQMFNEYTAALLDEIPPPQLPTEEEETEEQQASDGTSKTVKVIHFGLV